MDEQKLPIFILDVCSLNLGLTTDGTCAHDHSISTDNKMVDTSVSKNIVSLTHAACCVEVQVVATAQLEQHLTTPEDLAFRFLQQWCIQFFDESPAAE